jgi:hypothetical protein
VAPFTIHDPDGLITVSAELVSVVTPTAWGDAAHDKYDVAVWDSVNVAPPTPAIPCTVIWFKLTLVFAKIAWS